MLLLLACIAHGWTLSQCEFASAGAIRGARTFRNGYAPVVALRRGSKEGGDNSWGMQQVKSLHFRLSGTPQIFFLRDITALRHCFSKGTNRMGATNTIFPLPAHPRDDRLREIDVVGSEANQCAKRWTVQEKSKMCIIGNVQSSGLTYKNHSQRGLQRCRISVGTRSGVHVAGRGFLNIPGNYFTVKICVSIYNSGLRCARGLVHQSI